MQCGELVFDTSFLCLYTLITDPNLDPDSAGVEPTDLPLRFCSQPIYPTSKLPREQSHTSG